LYFVLKKGTTSYGIGERLAAGSYTAKVTYSLQDVSATADFEVVASTPVVASEGHGYTTPKAFSDTMTSYPNLSTLEFAPLNAIGTRKILVIPVYFTGNATFSASELSVINKAYNGASSDTGWESLSSYYSKSSYGKLSIQATVTEPYCYSMTDTELTAKSKAAGDNYAKLTDALAVSALSSFASTYNLSDYDENSDGYVDGLELVYKTTQPDLQEGGQNIWWNFTSVGPENQTASENAGIYFWSEFSRLADGYYDPDIDCHTLVHESGHMMGLDDYYSYDEDTGAPTGCADMMDCNVGDHNAYSKMLLGWTTPRYIDGKEEDFTITLNSFTDTGDCVLLRNTATDPWNGTPYDEYLILQYYTPTGVNEADSQGYPEWKAGPYAKAGLQVFHVDSRIVTQSGSHYVYTDTPTDDAYLVSSNTPSYSIDVAKTTTSTTVVNSPYRKLQAIPASGKNIFGTTSYFDHFGEQDVLFGTSAYGAGSSYFSSYAMKSLFPNGTQFNDGSSLDYCFSVTSQSDSDITLRFLKY
jgi:M6 family metalloprotease-like protein